MDNANVVDFPSPETSIDSLNELLRHGARQLIEQAVQAELQVLLDETSERRLPDGRAAVVRSGYQPEREVQTGIGPVTIRIPKVRARDGRPVSFHSALAPSYVRKKEQFKQIWHTESKCDAEKEFDTFVKMYEAKYPKATTCLEKDREEMLAFFDFPAEHWQSIRTTNPIESSFATIRHREVDPIRWAAQG